MAPLPVPEGEAAYWDIDDIQFHCRIGRTRAWRLVREPNFPTPVVLGPKIIVWPRGEVVSFIESKRRPDHYATAKSVATNANAAPYGRRLVRSRERRS